MIHNPESSNPLSELIYAAYDKTNDLLGGRLPLTTAEKANIKLYQYAKDNGYELDLSNHSRGGLTASVAIQHANRHGLTAVPIRESRLYGTATNVKDYAQWLRNKNAYTYEDTDGEKYSTAVFSAVHYTDFVGRSPLIAFRSKYAVGGNEPTGGVEDRWLLYSHSSYFREKPKDEMMDNQGYSIDRDGNRVSSPVDNPYAKDFKKKWIVGKNNNQNTDNPSLPVLVKPTQPQEGVNYHETPH